MSSDEKVAALKNAYSEMILNISKESAEKVAASERKAERLEHELKASKEEGVQLLVRLKQMMDSKVMESEASALIQQKKIDELAAQLHEAEDIIEALRGELEETQEELEMLKSASSKKEPDSICPTEVLVEDRGYPFQFSKNLGPIVQGVPNAAPEVTIPYLVPEDKCLKSCDKVVCKYCSYLANHNLPSIIMRPKGQGLYKNGFMQRIRACDRNQEEWEKGLSGKAGAVKNDGYPEEDENMSEKVKDVSKALVKASSELEQKPLEGTKIDVIDDKIGVDSETNAVRKGEMIIKHTYQRKRMRQALRDSGPNSSDEMEKTMVDKPNSYQKPKLELEPGSELPLSVLLLESRERKRMEKAARVLIAMSQGKRWI